MESTATQTNIGTIERIARIVVGLVLLSLVFVGPRSLWGLVGLIPLATALFGFCPAYRVLGICTRPGSGRAAQ